MAGPEVFFHEFHRASSVWTHKAVEHWTARTLATMTNQQVEAHRASDQEALNSIRAVLDAYEQAYLQPKQAPLEEQLL